MTTTDAGLLAGVTVLVLAICMSFLVGWGAGEQKTNKKWIAELVKRDLGTMVTDTNRLQSELYKTFVWKEK